MNRPQDVYEHDIEEIRLGADLNVELPSQEEVDEVTNQFKNNKAPGIDQITAEFIKNGGKCLNNSVHELICEVWKSEDMPKY